MQLCNADKCRTPTYNCSADLRYHYRNSLYWQCCGTLNIIKAHICADASVVSGTYNSVILGHQTMLATLLLVYCLEWMLVNVKVWSSRQAEYQQQCSQAAVVYTKNTNRKCYVNTTQSGMDGCQIRLCLQLHVVHVIGWGPTIASTDSWVSRVYPYLFHIFN